MAIDVKKTDFEESVIRKSHSIPVLVDFWADWCSPCKVLGPILEIAEIEFKNRFLLAKINTQFETEIAAKFKISSIPHVILFENGGVKDQFIGALSAEQVKLFLNKNIPHPELKNIQCLLLENRFQEAGDEILKHRITGPMADLLLWDVFRGLLKSEMDFEAIRKYIEPISDYGTRYSEIKSKFQDFYKNSLTETESVKRLRNVLNDDLIISSLEYFLEKIINSSGNEREKYKVALFCSFHLMDENPLVNEYRRKLSSALF